MNIFRRGHRVQGKLVLDKGIKRGGADSIGELNIGRVLSGFRSNSVTKTRTPPLAFRRQFFQAAAFFPTTVVRPLSPLSSFQFVFVNFVNARPANSNFVLLVVTATAVASFGSVRLTIFTPFTFTGRRLRSLKFHRSFWKHEPYDRTF